MPTWDAIPCRAAIAIGLDVISQLVLHPLVAVYPEPIQPQHVLEPVEAFLHHVLVPVDVMNFLVLGGGAQS